MKMKLCSDCLVEFVVRGQNHKRCDQCAKKNNLLKMRKWRIENVVTGEGSGGKPGALNGAYRHGICTMRRWAKERLASLNNCCERCGNLIDVSLKGTWAGHHKDHNRLNNIPENLEVLCKRCHQVEHECWRALQGVTTISKESTAEMLEAPST